ncbi:MAG: 2-amino-4-hydroxy-6-hydroxymethyldihydropteridine diphosphokinase [Porticoccus sp.]|nr:2-amino-4-hydroxy-6-hydroxymethyldihydropteridine diphosphokinase [Porticoccus sp.]MBQ0806727.1 2-amino-4-hydroxy-6-hydroxymethyldihydropteridine diphosphokinase [Porticoccus sp.]
MRQETKTKQPGKELGLRQVIISVGSNIDPQNNIRLSHEVLDNETRLLAVADIIKTTPIGYTQQPDFLNTAYLIETNLEYDDFNAFLKSVEDRLGRERGAIKSGPRTIDLDIIVWGRNIVTQDYFNYEYVSTPVNQILTARQISVYS